MRIIQTASLTPTSILSPDEALWVYNGLDCGVTLEVLEHILPQLDNVSGNTYAFRRAMQGPILEMNMRGIKVDIFARNELVQAYEKEVNQLLGSLDEIIFGAFGIKLNPNSPKQLLELFYSILGIPPIKKRNAKGQYVPTVNREALEQLDAYFIARPIVSHLLRIRDLNKKIGTLKTDIDADGRMRTSYNIGGTTTGRLSSNMSDFGSGTNLQNIEERLRRIFIADPGFKLAYIDGEQAESRVCGGIHWNLFSDPTYLDACESGDLHTTVCRLAWQNLPWTGDIKKDREIAEQPFYRQHSYRHMAKVLGHGTNYKGQPYTMAKHTKLEASIIKQFQSVYFKAFPAFPKWHDWVAENLYRTGQMTTMLGMRRSFFGRRNEGETIRQAVAFEPQSTVGELINYGLLAVWKLNICQVLLQIHDAIVFQYPEDQEDKIIPQVVAAFQVPIELKGGRKLIIPSEVKTGWNWANADKDNPDGLKKYNGTDTRTRSQGSSILDRRFS